MADTPRTTTSIREKFGIDYLIPQSQSVESPARSVIDPGIERALAAYGHRILQIVARRPDKTSRVFDIVDATGLDVTTVQGVVDRMVSTELVQIEDIGKYGNRKVKITPTGEQML